jgi:hypothetical protein
MNYLKLFDDISLFESLNTNSWIDDDFSSIEEISKLIELYYSDHEYSNLMSRMDDILSSASDIDFFADELMRYTDILSAVGVIVSSKDTHLSRFDEFLDILLEIQEESKHDLSIEEIEDLFLDLDYKYHITKSNVSIRGENIPAFKVEINKVIELDFMMLINRIWNTVGGRLPRDYQINKLEMERESDGIYFTLLIVKNFTNLPNDSHS